MKLKLKKPRTDAYRALAWFGFPFALALLPAAKLLPLWAALLLGALCGGCGLVLKLKKAKLPRLTAALLGAALALFWFSGWNALMLAPARNADGQELTYTAVVTDDCVEYDYSVGTRVHVNGIGNAYLYLKEGGDLPVGTVLTGTAKCTFAADSQLAKGIRLVMNGDSAENAGTSRSPRYWPALVSAQVRGAVDRLWSGDTAGLFRALLTGDRSGLSDSTSTALSRCGMSHVAAVSGLHMGILVTALCLFFRKRSQRLVILPVLVLFALMVGSPSAYRALLMEALILIAPLLHRESDGLTSVAFALLLILLCNPYAVLSVSLQMSFAAVLGILLIMPRVCGFLMKLGPGKSKKRPLKGLWAAFCSTFSVSFGATVLTLPLSAFYFDRISLIALPANLLLVWLFTPLLVLGMLAVLVNLLFPSALFVGVVPGLLARGILWCVRLLGGLTFAAVPVSGVYFGLFAFYLAGVLVLTAVTPSLREKPWRSVSGVVVILCLCLFCNRAELQTTELTVSLLDVGQGQCIFFSSDGYFAAVDCGGSGGTSAGDILSDTVNSYGGDTLDLLVLTHYDRDHINGIVELFDRLTVKTVIGPALWEDSQWVDTLTALCEEEGTTLLTLRQDGDYSIGKCELNLYPSGDGSTSNDTALCVLCSCESFRFLATGDMDSAGEEELMASHDLPDLDVLVAGHHGSRYSTCEDFLEDVTPEAAVISVGENNSYGHPAEETLERLEADDIQIWRTDENGTITIRVFGD